MAEEVVGVGEEMTEGGGDRGDGVRCGSEESRGDRDGVMTLGEITVVW